MPNELTKSNKSTNLKEYLMSPASQDAIARVAVGNIAPSRLASLALLAAKDEKLRNCTPESWLKVLLDCAKYGLEPLLGRVYIIPYGNEAQCQLGYLGLIDIIRRNESIASIVAETVWEGDEFTVEYGTEPKFKHVPKFAPQKDRNNFKFVYALAKFKDGTFQPCVMTKDEIEIVRTKSSKASNSPAWKDYYNEMAKKVVLRRLCKMLPITLEAAEAIQKDDERFFASPTEPELAPPLNELQRAHKAVVEKAVNAKKQAEIIEVAMNAIPAPSEPEDDDDFWDEHKMEMEGEA
jgi:recombination protein RecT